MANEFSTVECCEEHGTATERLGIDGGEASVTLRCPWSSRWSLINDIVGNRRAWPYHAGLRASSAGAVPFPSKGSTSGQALQYQDALVTVKYSSLEEVDLLAETLEPNVEFITLDHKYFRWGTSTGDPLLENEAPGARMYSLSIVRTLFKVSSVPAAILTLPGTVNNSTYASSILGLSFAAETLMFQPRSISRTITTAGSQGWDVTVAFLFRQAGWNKFYRAKSGEFEEIYNTEAEVVHKNYPLASYSSFLY